MAAYLAVDSATARSEHGPGRLGFLRQTGFGAFPFHRGDQPTDCNHFTRSAFGMATFLEIFAVGTPECGEDAGPRLLRDLFFAATGVRLRHLPIRPAAVLAALASKKKGG